MRHGRLSPIVGSALIAMLAVPFTGLAQVQPQKHQQKHKHYTLIDLGTLGGPNSFLNGDSRVLNSGGAAAGIADTSVYDPNCGCYVDHAFRWRNGVMTDLGTLPGGANSIANSINSGGAVAGWSENGFVDPLSGIPAFVATVWNHGQVRDLGTLGGSFSGAIGVNDRGEAAGFAANTILDPDGFSTLLLFGVSVPTTQWHAALWQTNGTIEDLGTLGGPASFAIFANERGQVAGLSYTDSVPNPETGMPTVAPFIWENGQMTNLGSLGGPCAETAGLNNRGQVAGTSCTGVWAHAYLWHDGTMQDLGTLGGTYSRADGLNDSGEVVGQSSPAGDQSFDGYLWRDGVMTDLGSIGSDGCSNALSINAKSQIVGESASCDGDSHHPYIWENGGPMVDLNTLVSPASDILVHEPLFISDQGEIAASGDLPNGDQHAVLLIPKDGDDEAESELATPDGALTERRTAANANHATLTPEKLAKLRTRFLARHRGLGSRASR